MKKLQEKIKSIGVMLMLVFPMCLILTLLCSDYRSESEYNQNVVFCKYLVNWYTFITLPIGMLLVTLTLSRKKS